VPDKFRGTLSAREVARSMARGASAAGWEALELPLADGGEGTLDALGGANKTTVVTGPLGLPVTAGWRLQGERAVIEMATASGLALAGGREGNDPWGATTRGTGELIAEAINQGARDVIVAVGGSATTDGGAGALEALSWRPFARSGATVRVACDVKTRFLDAGSVFGPQKGAGDELVPRLRERLEQAAAGYEDRFGIDVRGLEGSGAAGGLAGGLAALGAEIVPGFDLVSTALGLEGAIARSTAVVTGEGRLDPTSLAGKVVGGVAAMARQQGRPVLAVVGTAVLSHGDPLDFVSLSEVYGDERAWAEPAQLVSEVTRVWLAGLSDPG